MIYRLEFTWPDYKKYSGQTDAPSIDKAVSNLLFRGRNKGGFGRANTSEILERILEEKAYEDLDEFPNAPKRTIVEPLPPMDDEGEAVDGKEALGANQTEQEIGADVGLPTDRELSVPYDQGATKPDDSAKHPHFFRDQQEIEDPFQV